MPVMPSSAERQERLGKPKPPKMGTLNPARVEIPDVENLLAKMAEVCEPERKRCWYGCQCPACKIGNCLKCSSESMPW